MKRNTIFGSALLAAFILSGVEQVTAQTATPKENKEFKLHQSPEGAVVQHNDYYIKPKAEKEEAKKTQLAVMIQFRDEKPGYVFENIVRAQNDTMGLYVYKSADDKVCFTGTHQFFDKKQYHDLNAKAKGDYEAPQYQGYGIKIAYIKKPATVNSGSLDNIVSEICKRVEIPVENRHQPHGMPPTEFIPDHIKSQVVIPLKIN